MSIGVCFLYFTGTDRNGAGGGLGEKDEGTKRILGPDSVAIKVSEMQRRVR